MGARRASLGAVLLAGAALAAAGDAAARTLYKWVDAQGKTQYSDKRPVGFKGPVVLIETDPEPVPDAPPARRPAPEPAASEAQAEPPGPDMATQRRANRQRLAAHVASARAALERARKALADAASPDLDERQVIQQRVVKADRGAARHLPNPDPTQARATSGGMHGMAPRSNCREALGADGKKATICPTMVPSEAYFERVAALEDAVRRAEEALEEAERAYRQGAD